jgi:hypothetical protein
MLKEALYTSIGATALAAEFVTHPQRSQSWLKKAERRGGKFVASYEQRVRKLTKRTGSTIGDLRSSYMSAIGLAEGKVERTERKAATAVKRTTRKARRSRPRAKVTGRTRRAGNRRVRSTTLTVQTPAIAS